MKISAISSNHPVKSLTVRNGYKAKVSEANNPNFITFKSGNPKHIFNQISEISMFGLGSGGVGTVGNDFFFNVDEFDRVVQNIPLYNQDVAYAKDIDPLTGKLIGVKQDGVKVRKIPNNLPADHPLKTYEGCHYVTPVNIPKDADIVEILRKDSKKVFIVDEISTSKMAWGLEKEVPVSIYKARKDNNFLEFLRKNKGWSEEQIRKVDITFTFVDSTSSMTKPYADGSYATATGDKLSREISMGWQGKPYAKEAKATAELMPVLKEKMGGFDPKFVVCHDGQAMPLTHFMAEKNASGNSYWLDKTVTSIGHNLNDGYMYSMSIKDMIVTLGTPDEIKKITDSKEYIEALKSGKEEDFLKTLLPKELLDGRGQTNAVMFSIGYGEKGYVPMFTTVSEGYYKSIIENELVSPALHARLKKLSDEGRFKGIINALMDPQASGLTTDGLQEYYKKDCKIKLADGKEVNIEKFIPIEESKKYDLKHLRDVKKHNKISLLKRLKTEYKNAQLFDSGNNKWLDAGSGFSAAVTGGTGRKVSIVGGIDDKFTKMLEQGKDVPMFVSWGRGDFQKGMDTGLEAFVKFVKKTGNKDAIYIFGGDMSNLKDVVKLTKELNKDPLLQGRIVLLDGWAPGSSFAAAGDYAMLASRFAPCELTDLESMKKGCIPIVPKVQGMDQKVFDPLSNSPYINGYKGLHEYYMSEADALKAATQENQEAFTKAKETVVKALKKDYKSKLGEEIPADLLDKQLKGNEKYTKALQKLRDSVISDDMASCMERALKERNSEVAKNMLKNHIDLSTQFASNNWMSPSGKSTGQLYRELHFNQSYGKNLDKKDVFKLDLSKISNTRSSEKSFGSKIKSLLGTRGGKLTMLIGGCLALAGIGYGIYKSGNTQKPNTIESNSINNKNLTKNTRNKEQHLSLIG